jgi:outer membrane protein OmpA-like peptidoglycan-associated protein
MKLRSALLAATVLAAPVAAKAQAVSGLYIGAGAGANFMQDESLSRTSYPFRGSAPLGSLTGSGNIHLDTGFVGVVSVGYGLGNGLRFELEGNYRTNKLTKITGTNSNNTFANGGGDEQKYGGMFNVLYDIDPAVFGMGTIPVIPYVGVGAGYEWAQERNAHFYGNSGAVAGFPNGINSLYRTNEGKGSFAYQGIVGASLPIAAVPGLSLTAEYRFMGLATNRTYNAQYFASGPTAGGIATRARVTFDDDYNHSVLLGIRYAFNAAPAPIPMQAPPPAVRNDSRTYLVFFDWDRADLTDRARQIIAEAAQATTRVQVTRIQVSGHTDASGTARYNQGLSVRRAQNVAAELVRLGVPRQAITTQGYGSTRPLVPTAAGVREPQNRRVEIVLQ